MINPSADNYDLLGEMVDQCREVEKLWFARNFWPNYDTYIGVMRDMQLRRQKTSEWTEVGRRSSDGNNHNEYTLEEVADRWDVSLDWIRVNITDVMRHDPRRNVETFQSVAAQNYAEYLVRADPKMPLERVTDLVHEFIPNIQSDSIRRGLRRRMDPKDLVAHEVSNSLVRAQKHRTPKTGDDLEAFMDELYAHQPKGAE